MTKTTTDRPTETAPTCCLNPDHDALRRRLEWLEPEIGRVREQRDTLARENENIADRRESFTRAPDATKDYRGIAMAQRELIDKQAEEARVSSYFARLDTERHTILGQLRECASGRR